MPPQDVQMKDETGAKKDKQFYFTSDAQESISLDKIQDQILDQPVTLSLRQIIGISQGVQRKMGDLVRSRREYMNKSGQYDLFTSQAEDLFRMENSEEAQIVQPGDRIFGPSPDELDAFLVRYSNAVSFRPSKFYAMATGVFRAKINDEEFTFMVDSGSELNLIPESIVNRLSLAIDYEGMRWSLKGVHGNPVQLRGVCKDLPLTIGGHSFAHHFFVSQSEVGKQDCILGQPWIQWFSARIDYTRIGNMSMTLWKNGNRNESATLNIALVRADNERNIDSLDPNPPYSSNSRARSSQHAYIEEIVDEQDFY
jgi:hypothetical protein